MGIVKISDGMHANLRLAGNALSRSINAQAEHWMRIGLLAELYPDMNHHEICKLLIRVEQSGGLDVQKLCVEGGFLSDGESRTASGASI